MCAGQWRTFWKHQQIINLHIFHIYFLIDEFFVVKYSNKNRHKDDSYQSPVPKISLFAIQRCRRSKGAKMYAGQWRTFGSTSKSLICTKYSKKRFHKKSTSDSKSLILRSHVLNIQRIFPIVAVSDLHKMFKK